MRILFRTEPTIVVLSRCIYSTCKPDPTIELSKIIWSISILPNKKHQLHFVYFVHFFMFLFLYYFCMCFSWSIMGTFFLPPFYFFYLFIILLLHCQTLFSVHSWTGKTVKPGSRFWQPVFGIRIRQRTFFFFFYTVNLIICRNRLESCGLCLI